MKTALIVSIIAFSAVGIGLFQQSRMVGLKRESVEIMRKRGVSAGTFAENRDNYSSSRGSDQRRSSDVSRHEPITELASRLVDMAANAETRYARVMGGVPMTPEEQAVEKKLEVSLFNAFAALESAEVLELIHQLEANPNLPTTFRENPARACVEILREVNPKVLLDVIPGLKNYPNAGEVMTGAFSRWLQASPVAAIKWFDDGTRERVPAIDFAGYVSTVILEEVRLSPEHALERALSQERAGDLEGMTNIGANIPWRLGEAAENSAFFSALRQQMEKFPDSLLLADIRSDYLGEFRRLLNKWPFESTVGMLDSGCTPSEKLVIAGDLYQGDLVEADRWATWTMGLTPPVEGEHPLIDFFSRWASMEPRAASKWLEGTPSGELKDQLWEKYSVKLHLPSEKR